MQIALTKHVEFNVEIAKTCMPDKDNYFLIWYRLLPPNPLPRSPVACDSNPKPYGWMWVFTIRLSLARMPKKEFPILKS